jgi:hypothetical protein
MSNDAAAAVLERIRAITTRAAREAAGAAIAPDPHPPRRCAPTADAEPEAGVPRHWSDTDGED